MQFVKIVIFKGLQGIHKPFQHFPARLIESLACVTVKFQIEHERIEPINSIEAQSLFVDFIELALLFDCP